MSIKVQARPSVVTDTGTRRGTFDIGELVEVRNRFDDRWIHGFAVAVVGDAAYQLRRLSDGYVLPAWFAADVVRPDPAA